MLTINKTTSTRKLIAIAALCGFTILADSNASRADVYETAEKGACAFSQQLASDPYARTQYLMEVNAATPTSTNGYKDVETMYGMIIPTSYSAGGKAEIDSFSLDCITCHDGMTAPAQELRYKNNPRNRTVDIDSVTGSHPIGMHYESYTYANRELKNIQHVNPGMIFVDGKVGCLTCHNPLNPAKNHLVMSNRASNLCFSCHNK